METILKDKILLVTGGTSRLGEAFVLEALAAGARVYFTFHRSKETAKRLAEKGATAFCVDLADRISIRDFLSDFKRQIPYLDVLVHNAAAIRDGLIRDMSEEDWDYVMSVDLKAPYYLTQQLLPVLFLAPRPAKIFMLTSRMAYGGAQGASNYAAAKAGVVALVKTLAQELGKKGVLVNGLNPGFMESKMTGGLSPEMIEYHRRLSPLRKVSDPQEVARFLVYLCSGAVQQVTGQILHYESRLMPL